jgi:CD2 antigen cytoplasmic tail-binding protein 2
MSYVACYTASPDFNFILTEVMWEFKWDEKSTDIHGPHTTSQMQAWVNEGYFKNSVLVRKCGTDGQFYNSSRVDFELYL